MVGYNIKKMIVDRGMTQTQLADALGISKGKKMGYQYFRAHHFDNILEENCFEPYTPHDTRHTFVTNMRNAGVEKLLIQKIVGHKPQDVTDKVYTHIKNEELIEAIDMLG